MHRWLQTYSRGMVFSTGMSDGYLAFLPCFPTQAVWIQVGWKLIPFHDREVVQLAAMASKSCDTRAAHSQHSDCKARKGAPLITLPLFFPCNCEELRYFRTGLCCGTWLHQALYRSTRTIPVQTLSIPAQASNLQLSPVHHQSSRSLAGSLMSALNHQQAFKRFLKLPPAVQSLTWLLKSWIHSWPTLLGSCALTWPCWWGFGALWSLVDSRFACWINVGCLSSGLNDGPKVTALSTLSSLLRAVLFIKIPCPRKPYSGFPSLLLGGLGHWVPLPTW